MTTPCNIDGLSECIARAVQEHLKNSNIEWPGLDGIDHPRLRIEAFLEDGGQDATQDARSEKIVSVSSSQNELFNQTFCSLNISRGQLEASVYVLVPAVRTGDSASARG